MAKLLTQKAIERMNKPGEVGDAGAVGLYLRVTPAGRKVWRYRYQLRGKTSIMTLGDWKDPRTVTESDSCLTLMEARAEAGKHRLEVIKGNHPAAAAQKAKSESRAMPTVTEFIDEYIKRYAKKKKKSWHQDNLILQRWLVPDIGRMRMDEVTRRDIVGILDKCHDAGNTRMPGKVLAAARMLFKFAIQRGVLESTPCMYIEESQPEPAQKAMTEDEIRQWWTATGNVLEKNGRPPMQKTLALALRLLLLTGQRPGEVAGMTRDELQLDSPLGPHWIIDAERRKKGRAAKGKAHAVALEPEAVAVIQAAMEYADDEHIFPKASGGPHATSAMGEKVREVVYKDWEHKPTPHAARHTVATELEELGIEEYHIGRVLGHASTSVTGQVYINNRVNEATLNNQRKHLAAWEARLMQIIKGEKGDSNVVRMEARA